MKIIAHRGASIEAFENSREAFEKAIEIGVDAIELDCLMSLDRVPVVTHYNDLRALKLADGYVHQLPAAELQKLGILTLEEAIELIRPSSCTIVFDIKIQPFVYEAGLFTAATAQHMLPPEKILLSSFYWQHLVRLRREYPHLKRGLILRWPYLKYLPMFVLKKYFRFSSIHPRVDWLTPFSMRHWKSHGLQVYAWVANSEADIRTCADLGVDGIFTDDPRKAKEVLKNHA